MISINTDASNPYNLRNLRILISSPTATFSARICLKATPRPSQFQVSKTYEPNRDLITTVSNKFGTATISAFYYENDGFGRRTARKDTTPSLTVNNAFVYNLKSEVASATMGENQYGYEYDPIGNRVQSTLAVGSGQSETNTYSANSLNQYSSITNNLPSNDLQPKYDLDGNMVTNGVWSHLESPNGINVYKSSTQHDYGSFF